MRSHLSVTLVALTCCLTSGCASDVVQNEGRYFGCYALNGFPELLITEHGVYNERGSRTELKGFKVFRNSDFLMVRNRMFVDTNAHVAFTPAATGFNYEFDRNGNHDLILFNERGDQFGLARIGPKCR